MSNPYSSPIQPNKPDYGPYGGGQFQPPGGGQDGYVKQVPVIGILMMVQAALELLAGIGLVAIGVGMPAMIKWIEEQEGRRTQEMPEGVETMMLVIYGGIGVGVLAIGALRLFAGFRVFKYHNRMLGIIANSFGFATALTCYCSATSLALGIYALVVLLQPSVVQEFERRRNQF